MNPVNTPQFMPDECYICNLAYSCNIRKLKKTMDSKEPTCALNLRGFSTDLKWKCRKKAADKRETLLQYVERVLRQDVEAENTPTKQQGKSSAKRKTT